MHPGLTLGYVLVVSTLYKYKYNFMKKHIFKDMRNNDIVHVIGLMFEPFGYVLFLFSFPLGQSFYINTALRHPRERKRPGRRIFCSSQLGPTNYQLSSPNQTSIFSTNEQLNSLPGLFLAALSLRYHNSKVQTSKQALSQ